MPPVFEQPGQGRSRSYEQLASALQSRYAADADRQLRANLAYAELDQRQALAEQGFALDMARLQMQPILQEQARRGQLDNWMMQQEFNQRDQAELNRQSALLSELMDKHAKGEISDAELYRRAPQIAPRVDMLKTKQQYTLNAALVEEKKQRAAAFEEQIAMRDRMAAYQEQELEGKLDLWVSPKYAKALVGIMADGYPDLKPGTPEYTAQYKAVADEMGWAVPFAKEPNGKPIFLKDLQEAGAIGATGARGTRGTRSAGGGLSEKDVADHIITAEKAAEDWAKRQETPPSQEEIDAKAAAVLQKIEAGLSSYRAGTPEGKKAAALEGHQKAISSQDMTITQLREMPGISDEERKGAIGLVTQIKKLMADYPPGERPSVIQNKIDELTKQYQQFEEVIAARQAKVAAAQSAQAQAQQQGGNQILNTSGPKISTELLETAVGMGVGAFKKGAGRLAQNARQLNPVGAELVDKVVESLPEAPTKEDIRKLLTTRFSDFFQ